MQQQGKHNMNNETKERMDKFFKTQVLIDALPYLNNQLSKEKGFELAFMLAILASEYACTNLNKSHVLVDGTGFSLLRIDEFFKCYDLW